MVKRIKKARTVRRAAKKTSKGRRAQLAKAAESRRLSRRSKAAPEKGKLHYLLRNIPRDVWTKFLATRPDARFDLLTYITTTVEKLNGMPEQPEAPAAPEGYGATDQPAARLQTEPVDSAAAPVTEEPAINQ